MERAEIIGLSPIIIEPIVRAALAEDLGRAGDITSDAIIPAEARARGILAARQPGIVAGIEVAATAFRLLDPQTKVEVLRHDGDDVTAGAAIATVAGKARALLSAERVALNFLCRLSGIATATRALVDAVQGTRARVCDTRKTTPSLRALEKYAVRVGGGVNHRFGLDDAVLIKDNHIALAGGIGASVSKARERLGHMVKIEIEVDRLEQVREAIDARADVIMLDNMPIPDMRRAAGMASAAGVVVEASGRITAESAAAIAATGVDMISAGWITHSAPILDIGLDFESD
ncbi:MAG TPA: carboxylating nicotinate-nucleotide diphosphorylase [Stellaceae bacterium]|nr:carboxylating nicotinate-nucleotide diphosphorylase [Stellaceae bacterium]